MRLSIQRHILAMISLPFLLSDLYMFHHPLPAIIILISKLQDCSSNAIELSCPEAISTIHIDMLYQPRNSHSSLELI